MFNIFYVGFLLQILLCVTFSSGSCDQKIITAESGQNITLTCRAPNNNNVVVEWSRADLNEGYVFLYRDDQFDPEDQHPSFKNRVDLQDRQMKDGDMSLILKDVTINDTGKYECRVFKRGTKRRNRALLKTDPISIINLKIVDPPEQKNITAEPRKKIILPCLVPNNNKNRVIQWRRADLGDEYVFLHRDGHFEPFKQHPSFRKRADLLEKEMKDGEVSLILKHVMINDTGKYECCVFMKETYSWKTISIIYLSVYLPVERRDRLVSVLIVLIVLIAVIAVIVC